MVTVVITHYGSHRAFNFLHWRECMVLWNSPLTGLHGVRDVLVLHHPATRRYPQTFSDGACYLSAWRTGQRRPADILGALLAQGFENHAELRRTLVEFGKVTGCGWAGRMLDGIKAWEGTP